MEEKIIREFLTNCGLKPKEIAERLQMKVRTINNWLKGGNIAPYMCQLVYLTFTDYNIQTGSKLEEPEGVYNDASQLINEKNTEIERLQERCAILEENKILQARNIELLEEQIQLYKDRLKNYEGKTAS